MKQLFYRSGSGLFVDIGLSSVKLRLGDRGTELALERTDSGQLTETAREKLRHEVGEFLKNGDRRSPRSAFCGLPAQGVTLRRWTLPPAAPDETRRLLAMQVEAKFPLPPDKLSWGYATAAELNGVRPEISESETEAVVVAMRRQTLDDYARLLMDSGLRPTFLLGIWASSRLCFQSDGGPGGETYVLDIGRTHSELLHLRDGWPASLRCIAWGGNAVTQSIGEALGVGNTEAERLKLSWKGALGAAAAGGTSASDQLLVESVRRAVGSLVTELEVAISASRAGSGHDGATLEKRIVTTRPAGVLFLGGGGSHLPGIGDEIGTALGGLVKCQTLQDAETPGSSSVTRGLHSINASSRGRSARSSFQFLTREKLDGLRSQRPASVPRFWLAAAIVLFCLVVLLPAVAPLLRIPGLRDRIASTQKTRDALPAVAEELTFLELLEKGQLPYIEALAALAKAAPKGTQITSVSMNRAGEANVQGITGPFEQANDLRAKLTPHPFERVLHWDPVPKGKDKKQTAFRLRAVMRIAGTEERRGL